jgi:hypothetical protein
MSDATLVFEDSDAIGRVTAVDTSRVLIAIEDPIKMSHIGVGNLAAIRGATAQEYLIGIVERVTRSLREALLTEQEDAEGNIPSGAVPDDAMRVVLIGTFRAKEGVETNVFKRGVDSFPQIDRECFLISASNLQKLMNLLAQKIPKEEQLVLGRFSLDPDATAIAHGDRFFQRHASILGSTGSGKSWTVALLLERAAKLKHPNIIVLDLHGEYSPLTKGSTAIAESFRIAGPGDLESKADDLLFLPFWILSRDEMLSLLLDRSDSNAPNQSPRFTFHVKALKEDTLKHEGKKEALKTFTVDSPVPYDIKGLLSLLGTDNSSMVAGSRSEKQGPWFDKLTRFISRLEAKIEDRRNGFLFRPPVSAMAYEWLEAMMVRLLDSRKGEQCGIKIIDFSEVPSDILPVVIGVFARLLYNVQFWMKAQDRTPFTIICDEAHLYLPVKSDADSTEKSALEAFERIAKEGRKYGVSLLVVSQRPADVSKTILSQCNNFLAMRLSNDEDQNVVRRLMPDSMAGLVDILPLLDKGEALLLGDSIILPSRIKLDKPSLQPDSGTKDFWSEWSTKQPNAIAIRDAVETFRRQTRPREKLAADEA